MSHLFEAQPRSRPLAPAARHACRTGVDLRICTTGNRFVEMRDRLTNHRGFSRLGRTWADASVEGLAKRKANSPFQPTPNLAKP
jgi:hypothetical protein